MKPSLAFTALVFSVAAHGTHAASLSIDFGPATQTVDPAFVGFSLPNATLPPVTAQNYVAFSTTVGLRLEAANLPDGAADFRSVARNGSAAIQLNDWIGVDTRVAGVDVTLRIIFSGLPAGAYSWTSSHHDGGAGATNGNLLGSADYIMLDATGSSGLIANGITFSSQNLGQTPSVFSRQFTSNGVGDVSLSLIMDNGQGDPTNALFAFVNSVVISEVVPEPSGALLSLLAGAALMRRRR